MFKFKVLNFADVIFTDVYNVKDDYSLNIVNLICDKINEGCTIFDVPDDLSINEALKYRNVLDTLSSSILHLLTKRFRNKEDNRIYSYSEVLEETEGFTCNLKNISMYFEYDENNSYIYGIFNNEKLIV